MGYGARPCADAQPAQPATQAPQAKPLGRPPKHGDQRQRILATAARAIATEGYDKCSLASIAAILELTRPSLYHYFPTKQRIYTEIALAAAEGLAACVAAASDETLSSAEQLIRLMTAHAEYCDANYWAVSATLSRDGAPYLEEAARESFDNHRRAVVLTFEGALRRGIARGELRPCEPRMTARFVLQLLDISGWYRPEGARRAADFARESCDLLLAGLSWVSPATRTTSTPRTLSPAD